MFLASSALDRTTFTCMLACVIKLSLHSKVTIKYNGQWKPYKKNGLQSTRPTDQLGPANSAHLQAQLVLPKLCTKAYVQSKKRKQSTFFQTLSFKLTTQLKFCSVPHCFVQWHADYNQNSTGMELLSFLRCQPKR